MTDHDAGNGSGTVPEDLKEMLAAARMRVFACAGSKEFAAEDGLVIVNALDAARAKLARAEQDSERLRAERMLPMCEASNLRTGARCILLDHDGYHSHVQGDPCPKLAENESLKEALRKIAADDPHSPGWRREVAADALSARKAQAKG